MVASARQSQQLRRDSSHHQERGVKSTSSRARSATDSSSHDIKDSIRQKTEPRLDSAISNWCRLFPGHNTQNASYAVKVASVP